MVINNDCYEKEHKRIAIIPARSGSKGVKNKNIKTINGKTLIEYSVEAALKSAAFDTVFVSTDSSEYAAIAKSLGVDCHFLRSKNNSSDTASSWDAVREVINQFEIEGFFYDEIMLLQPTSPLRTSKDITNAIDVMKAKSAYAVESVVEMDHSPLWSNTLPPDGNMKNFFNKYSNMPRQSLPVYYRENGAIYLIKRFLLEKTDSAIFSEKCYAYIMPRERSVDIDDEIDFILASVMLGNNK